MDITQHKDSAMTSKEQGSQDCDSVLPPHTYTFETTAKYRLHLWQT